MGQEGRFQPAFVDPDDMITDLKPVDRNRPISLHGVVLPLPKEKRLALPDAGSSGKRENTGRGQKKRERLARQPMDPDKEVGPPKFDVAWLTGNCLPG